jgi:hypothetical protein
VRLKTDLEYQKSYVISKVLGLITGNRSEKLDRPGGTPGEIGTNPRRGYTHKRRKLDSDLSLFGDQILDRVNQWE